MYILFAKFSVHFNGRGHEFTTFLLSNYQKVKVETFVKIKIENDVTAVNGNDCNLDVTGTPLEDDCEITAISDWSVMNKLVKTNAWTDEEEQYAGISEDLATEIVNDINVGVGSKCNNGALFALCDGSTDDHQFLLYTEYDKDWNWRGVGKFTVSLSV